jgi:hypothetical protein
MKVQFETLRCRSAFDMAVRDSSPLFRAIPARLGPTQLVGWTMSYLPNDEPGLSVCIANGDTVPLESFSLLVGFLQERKRAPKHAATYADDLAPEFMSDRVCVLGNLFSRNFGHWTEELLKVAVLERAGVDCRFVIPTLPDFAAEWLMHLGIDVGRIVIVDRPTVFRRAVFTSAVSHQNITEYPQVLGAFRDLVRSGPKYGQPVWAAVVA